MRIDQKELKAEVIKSQEENAPTQRYMELVYEMAGKASNFATFRKKKLTKDWREILISDGYSRAIEMFHKPDITRDTKDIYNYVFTMISNAMKMSIQNNFNKHFEINRNVMLLNSIDYYSDNAKAGKDIYYDEKYDEEESEELKYKTVYTKKAVTSWNKYNTRTKEFEYNHLENGHNKGDYPVPKSEEQEKKWPKSRWKKELGFLVNGVYEKI